MRNTTIEEKVIPLQFTLRHSSSHTDIKEYVKSAIHIFNKYHNKVIDCQVILDHQKNDKVNNKFAEITAHVPSQIFVSKSHAETYEKAIDACVENICKQLQKHKEKTRGI